MNQLYICLIAVALLFNACSSQEIKNVENHHIKFINRSSGNKLEVLDWGGTGEPIFFLAGLGGTGHIFDDFAPNFTDAFHVYAITRRGFGVSDQPATDYSVATLAKDILAVADSLHLLRVILIGHSIAGEEISKTSSQYPHRVSKIIYLDAAYDRTSPAFTQMQAIPVQTPNPTALDSSSFAHWRDFNTRAYGFPFPDDELKQTAVFSTAGKYLKEVTPGFVTAGIFSSLERPNYTHIMCPALALYAKFKSVNEVIPTYAELDTINKKRANEFFTLFQKYSNTEQTQFKNEVRNGTVKTIDHANHYIFISNRAETEKIVRGFLK